MTWLVTRSPKHTWCWDLGDNEPDEDLVNAARVAAGFPSDERWVDDRSGWDIQVSGRPHQSVLEAATVGTVDELRAVDRTAVAEHAQTRKVQTRADQVAQLRAALADVDPSLLAEALEGVEAETKVVRP